MASAICLSRTLPLPHQPLPHFLLPWKLGRILWLPWWAESSRHDPLWPSGEVTRGNKYFYHLAFFFFSMFILEPSRHLVRKASSHIEMSGVGVLADPLRSRQSPDAWAGKPPDGHSTQPSSWVTALSPRGAHRLSSSSPTHNADLWAK